MEVHICILLTAGSLFTRLGLSILMIYQRYDDRVNRCKSVVADHHVSTSYPSTYIALLGMGSNRRMDHKQIEKTKNMCQSEEERGNGKAFHLLWTWMLILCEKHYYSPFVCIYVILVPPPRSTMLAGLTWVAVYRGMSVFLPAVVRSESMGGKRAT